MQPLRQQPAAARRLIIRRHILPARFQIAQQRRLPLIRSKSSTVSGIPTSCAIARKCSTAFVDPPLAATLAIAFSIAFGVMIWRWLHAFAHQLHHQPARFARSLQLFIEERRHA